MCQSEAVPERRLQSTMDLAGLAAAVDAAAVALLAAVVRPVEAVQARVSATQLRALRVVAEHGSLNLGGLADVLGVIPSSASRLCDRLVAAGLLRRELSEHNRREVTLTLQPAGRALLARLQAARQAELAAVLVRMSPEAAAALVHGLEEFARAAGPLQEGRQRA